MNVKALIFKVLLFILTISTFSCHENNMSEESENMMVKGGEGIGRIEFQGKNYPLNESLSSKMTSWSPPPLGINFYNSDGKYSDNYISIALSVNVYSTWTNLELPAGTYENIAVEFSLNNFEKQGIYNTATIPVTKMVVKKSGDDYDITLTGKTWLYLENDDRLHDFIMTWKGKINVIENNNVSPR
jgi:hypothetical protein